MEISRLTNDVAVVILNVGKYAPKFKMGFIVMSVLSVGEFSMIFVIRWFANREKRKASLKQERELDLNQEA